MYSSTEAPLRRSRGPGEGEALWFFGTLVTIKASGETTGGASPSSRTSHRVAPARRCTSTTARTSGST